MAVNIGSAVRAEVKVSDVLKSRGVWRNDFLKKLPLSGQNVQAIDLEW